MSVQNLTSLQRCKEGSTSWSSTRGFILTTVLSLPSPPKHPSNLVKNWSVVKNKWRFFFPLHSSALLYPTSSIFSSLLPLAPFLHRSVLCLDKVLLALCSGMASFCVDDGRVGVGGVVRALGLVGQIRSCGRREDKKSQGEKRGRRNKIAEAIKVKHWNCEIEPAGQNGKIW